MEWFGVGVRVSYHFVTHATILSPRPTPEGVVGRGLATAEACFLSYKHGIRLVKLSVCGLVRCVCGSVEPFVEGCADIGSALAYIFLIRARSRHIAAHVFGLFVWVGNALLSVLLVI